VGSDGLAYWRRGDGEPLLLLHGLGGTKLTWEPVAERVARERDLVAVDLPGFGDSPPLPDGTEPTAVALAAELGRFCEDLGLHRPHVAGNSLGAWVALEMGRAGAAASVTAISPAGLWRRPLGPRKTDVHRLARRTAPLLSVALRTAAGRRRVLAGTVGHPERVPAADARRLVMSWVRSRGYAAANEAMRRDLFDPAGYPNLPVTIAWGELDRLVRQPRRERMPAGARYLTLPDCGHTPMWDQPELVADLLLQGSAVPAPA
jgi:pimeloyl-ACP methyl ester carboxylesterase